MKYQLVRFHRWKGSNKSRNVTKERLVLDLTLGMCLGTIGSYQPGSQHQYLRPMFTTNLAEVMTLFFLYCSSQSVKVWVWILKISYNSNAFLKIFFFAKISILSPSFSHFSTMETGICPDSRFHRITHKMTSMMAFLVTWSRGNMIEES